MSYQALARKWRPHRFEALVGQEHVVRMLTNALQADRLHHAYLFSGTRGVGKTTLARILAKALNCETGVTAEPCGDCNVCREIDESRFPDLIEVDAASRTKVEETRELLEDVHYAPTRGRFKVYLVDEVHMLSTHSFNALLKTLEEPPERVKFLFATTDPQKVPVTVLSRCLQLHLKRLSPDQIRDHLEEVVTAEGIEAEREALPLLARGAEGSLRDGLSLLDQAIAFGGGAVREDAVRAMLGTLDQGDLLGLMEAVAAGDGSQVLAHAGHWAEQGHDFEGLLAELVAVLHRMALAQVVPDAFPPEVTERERWLALAERIPAETVQLYYQIALNGRRDMTYAPDGRSGFEMTLLRMLAFDPDQGGGRVQGATEPAAAAVKPPHADRTPTAPASAAVDAAHEVREPAPSAEGEDDLVRHWDDLVRRLPVKGPAQQLALNSRLVERGSAGYRIEVASGHGGLASDAIVKRLREGLESLLGESVRLQVGVAATDEAETPARRLQAEAATRKAEARQAIEQDPAVQAFIERFDAEIEEVRQRDTDA